jgi:hypothetical protein
MASFEGLFAAAAEYTRQRGISLSGQVGWGNNGTVWRTSRWSALKIHRLEDSYRREVEAYIRIGDAETIAGLSVPNLVDHDAKLLAIEMKIVKPPFLLDFASAYPIETAPQFPPEVMAEWLADKREQFGTDWPKAAAAIREVERRFGLRMLDVHPANIMLHPVRPDRQGP